MKLDFVFLADAATLQENGVFAVVGGGFDVITGHQFPVTKYAMALIGRLRFDPDECGKTYTIQCEIVAPDGTVLPPTLAISFAQSAHPRNPARPNVTTICFNYQGILFPGPGDYVFKLSSVDQTLGGMTVEGLSVGG